MYCTKYGTVAAALQQKDNKGKYRNVIEKRGYGSLAAAAAAEARDGYPFSGLRAYM